jgi:hypothetical protein
MASRAASPRDAAAGCRRAARAPCASVASARAFCLRRCAASRSERPAVPPEPRGDAAGCTPFVGCALLAAAQAVAATGVATAAAPTTVCASTGVAMGVAMGVATGVATGVSNVGSARDAGTNVASAAAVRGGEPRARQQSSARLIAEPLSSTCAKVGGAAGSSQGVEGALAERALLQSGHAPAASHTRCRLCAASAPINPLESTQSTERKHDGVARGAGEPACRHGAGTGALCAAPCACAPCPEGACACAMERARAPSTDGGIGEARALVMASAALTLAFKERDQADERRRRVRGVRAGTKLRSGSCGGGGGGGGGAGCGGWQGGGGGRSGHGLSERSREGRGGTCRRTGYDVGCRHGRCRRHRRRLLLRHHCRGPGRLLLCGR